MKKRRQWKSWSVAAVAAIALYVAWSLLRPLPPLKPVAAASSLSFDTPTASLSWPAVGQSAVGVVGTNILETHGVQKPAPTASTAKLITALVVLKQKPLLTGQQGPVITLTANDQAIYNTYVAEGGSTVAVAAGEQITEYQMLQAMLLPSANNMADSLAIWAYGSLPAYSAAANAYLKQLGLTNTTVGSDASGYRPSTVSTAADLVKLGELAMQNPVLAQIVGQPSANGIPVAGTIKNVNFLLGSHGVIGIKTGNTDQAGGVFVGAIATDLNQKPVVMVTALVGSPNLFQAMKDSLPLLQSAQANFATTTLLRTNDIVGQYRAPWGGSVAVVAGRNLAVTTWRGAAISSRLKLPALSNQAQAGQVVGSISAVDPITHATAAVPVQLKTAPPQPGLRWRLTHPLR